MDRDAEALSPDPGTATDTFTGTWLMLFPVTYLAHIAEEYWGGFPSRIGELVGFTFPEAAFLAANAVFWVLMCATVAWVLRRPSHTALAIALATIVVINAVIHLGASIAVGGYFPGLATGALLWLPLGGAALVRGHRRISRQAFRSGVLIGVIAHLLVPAVGLGSAMVAG